MSFHFPWVVPLISERSVWYNGKQPKFPQKVTKEIFPSKTFGRKTNVKYLILCKNNKGVTMQGRQK